jgi:hypothetical protein
MLALSALALAAAELSFLFSEPRRVALSATNAPPLDLRSFLMFSERYSGLGSKENGRLSGTPLSDMPGRAPQVSGDGRHGKGKAKVNGKMHNAARAKQVHVKAWYTLDVAPNSALSSSLKPVQNRLTFFSYVV